MYYLIDYLIDLDFLIEIFFHKIDVCQKNGRGNILRRIENKTVISGKYLKISAFCANCYILFRNFTNEKKIHF